jgi:flagellar hook-length control protein FliK
LPGQPSLNEVSADVNKQILVSIQSSLMSRDGDKQITVSLNPPELGKVFIRFQEQNSELRGFLEVNKAETRIEIEQALPQMIRDLADCGIQIRRLDVVFSEGDRSGYRTLDGQSPQDNGPHEQDSADSQTWDNDAYSKEINEWSSKNKSYQPISELHQMPVSDGSINVLV